MLRPSPRPSRCTRSRSQPTPSPTLRTTRTTRLRTWMRRETHLTTRALLRARLAQSCEQPQGQAPMGKPATTHEVREKCGQEKVCCCLRNGFCLHVCGVVVRCGTPPFGGLSMKSYRRAHFSTARFYSTPQFTFDRPYVFDVQEAKTVTVGCSFEVSWESHGKVTHSFCPRTDFLLWSLISSARHALNRVVGCCNTKRACTGFFCDSQRGSGVHSLRCLQHHTLFCLAKRKTVGRKGTIW